MRPLPYVSLLLCSVLLLSPCLHAATWGGGGSGNWIDDSWGLGGGAPGDGSHGGEEVNIVTNGDYVTLQAGNTFTTTNFLHLRASGNPTLTVFGTLTTDRREDCRDATLNILGSAVYTDSGIGFISDFTINVGTNAGDNPTVTMVDLRGGTVNHDRGTVNSSGNFRDLTYNLNGGTWNYTNTTLRFGTLRIVVSGGTLNVQGDLNIRNNDNTTNDYILDLVSGSVTISGDVSYSTAFRGGGETRMLRIRGGSFNVDGLLDFYNEDTGNPASDKRLIVDGSAATNISVGGFTNSTELGTQSNLVTFIPDSGGISTVNVTSIVPDFTDFTLQLDDFSSPWTTRGDLVLMEITGTVTPATPFANYAEGDPVTLVSGSRDHDFTFTYIGGDGNDIVLIDESARGTVFLLR